MNRLTKPYNEVWVKSYADGEIPTDLQKEIKLAKLEDIEEDLGIDLITLFKALRNGIYYKYLTENKITDKCYPKLSYVPELNRFRLSFLPKFDVNTEFYKMNWALTRKELEK